MNVVTIIYDDMLVNTVTNDFVREVICESTYELILEKSLKCDHCINYKSINYKCDHCDYACVQKGNLKKHVNNRHKDIISNALS